MSAGRSGRHLLVVGAVFGVALAFGATAASAAVSTVCATHADRLTTGVTLSVSDAAGTVVAADGDGYMACIFPNGDAYSIVIGLDDRGDGTSSEDMGTANLDRVFTLGFTLPDGMSAASAELYARVSSYAIAANGRDVTLAMQPVSLTSGTDDPVDPQPLQDRIATITGGIRVNSGGQTRGIPGMWIGASANSYRVTLSGSCPVWNTGAASGSTQPGAIAVRLWAPHLTAGTLASPVVNHGSLQAFIPAATVTACFGVATVADVVNALAVTRTEAAGGDTSLVAGTNFVATETAGGLLVSVPDVTFSSPTYTIRSTRATPPGKVAAAQTRAVGRTRATVRWRAATAGTPVTAYQTRIRRGSRWTPWTTARGGAKGGWFARTWTGLRPGTRYAVQIRAMSAAGAGRAVQVSFTTRR